jgi:lysophospholipase L1-like esterase
MLDHHIPPTAREKATGKVTEKASQVASATGLALIPAIFRAGYFTALLLFIALLPAAGSQSATNRTVLVMGDSISAAYGMSLEQGWVALLAGRLAASHPDWLVINASISGETSAGAAARLPALLEEHAPAVVIIELGGNDGLRGYPVKRLQANLQTMVEQSQAVGAEVLILHRSLPQQLRVGCRGHRHNAEPLHAGRRGHRSQPDAVRRHSSDRRCTTSAAGQRVVTPGAPA